jgi:hypothetical protein
MVRYTIVPQGRGYVILANDNNGVRRPIERFDTEDKAVRRLRELQSKAGMVQDRNNFLHPRKRS